jgi:hypothetical protein
MSDPQANAEALDDEELPEDLIPEQFIEADAWNAGAGSDEQAEHQDSLPDEDLIGQEREGALSAEEAAIHVEQGINESGE